MREASVAIRVRSPSARARSSPFRHSFAPRYGLAALAGVAVSLLLPGALGAQAGVALRGRVIDAAGNPLAGAVVEVLGSYRSVLTRADGGFKLRLPSAGEVRIRASRIGYTPQVIVLAVGDVAPSDSLVIRLAPDPVALRGISVEAPRAPPLAHTVTRATVRQVPPLAEPDVFRGVVLLPGVSQPNDLKGRIHLAGGSSDETGVRLDGHPLQDPFHLLGLFGAFNTAALERADVLIHHLPASQGGRLSGVIDLETRRVGAEPEYEGVLSLLSSSITASRPAGIGGVDVLAAGRITYLDRVLPRFVDDAPRLGFYDALVRLGRSWEPGWRAEAVVFTTRDHFEDEELAGLLGYEPLTWGESLVGLRAERRGVPWSLSARASFNRASIHLDERNLDPPAGRANHVDSRRDWLSGAVGVAYAAHRWRLDVGAGVDRRVNRQAWTARGLIDEIFSPNTPAEYAGEESLTLLSLFGEGAAELGSGWSAALGARVWSAGGVHVAPRVRLGLRVSDALALEIALNRRHQWDAQLEEPVEGSVTAPLFLLEEPRIADVAALSARLEPDELAFGARGAFHIQAFWKEYRERPILPERPSGEGRPETAGPDFPAFDRIRGRGAGAMLSGRLAFPGGALVQGSYTFQRVFEEIAGREYPTAWDVPHTLVLFGSVPVGARWMLNAAYHAYTGRATTPVVARVFAPVDGNFNRINARYILGERNSIRVPPYHRLDLSVRREGRLWGADVTVFFQVLNLLFRENAIDYDWLQYFRGVSSGHRSGAGRSGLPILPSIGVEARW